MATAAGAAAAPPDATPASDTVLLAWENLRATVAPLFKKSPLELLSDMYRLIPPASRRISRAILGVRDGENAGIMLTIGAVVLSWILTAGITAVLAPVFSVARTAALALTAAFAAWSALWASVKATWWTANTLYSWGSWILSFFVKDKKA
ncbi:hypothetical protein DFJ74DRAFT_649440 [Hyaloraphidium curvatum]|nr:hypothetical protein DFJ74DRAFT_649440 [Hyaloraphidium curvatum]